MALERGPKAVEALLSRATRPLSMDDEKNWLGLAEGATGRARLEFEEGNKEVGLAWSGCAAALYDALAEDVPGPHSVDVSGMYVRVTAMRHQGVAEGDPLRDPAAVVAWFRALLDSSREEALAASARLRASIGGPGFSREQALSIRQIKNRLGVIAALSEIVELSPDLQAWLGARDGLL